MKILMTGGSGFIGRAFIDKVIDKNHEIYNIGRSHCLSQEKPNLSCISFDLVNNKNGFIDELTVKPDVIIHFAQANKHSSPVDQALADFYVNHKTTVDLLEYGRKTKIKKFILFSSGGVYKKSQTKEELQINHSEAFQTGSYFFTKLSGEYYTKLYEDIFPTIILRPFFPYGPNQTMQRLIPRLIESVQSKRIITLETQNGIISNPIYIADLIELLEKVIQNCNDAVALDLCGNEVLSLRDIINIIANRVGVEPIIESTNKHDEYLCGNSTFASQLLGHSSRIPFSEGIMNCL